MNKQELKEKLIGEFAEKLPSWIILFRGKDEALPILAKNIRAFLSHSIDLACEEMGKAVRVEKRMVHGDEASETWKWGKEEWNAAITEQSKKIDEFLQK